MDLDRVLAPMIPPNYQSQSQAGQDIFVLAVLAGKKGGKFVEIGACHPIELSNTYELERALDWRGLMIDIDPNAIDLCRSVRTSHAECADATKFDWYTHLREHSVIDYASVDVDEVTSLALKQLIADATRAGTRFRILTVEHDAYSRGDRLRIPNRNLLANEGYELVAADVKHQGCAFEDWFVDPNLVDMNRAERFRSCGKEWNEVLAPRTG